jgi:hypothetical protein
VFEKRLIEAYINENGTDPVTGEPLSVEDLVDVKTSRIVRPRPPTLTSIPSLLGVFQEEWDALALETYTLRQTLAQTRQELSTALYQHDAAVRVIARLTKERDEARDALSKVSVGSARPAAGGEAMQVDSTGLPEAVLARIEATQESYVLCWSLFLELTVANLHSVSLNHAVNVQFPKVGPPTSQSKLLSLRKPPNLSIREVYHWPLMLQVISHWLGALTVLRVSIHFLSNVSFTP